MHIFLNEAPWSLRPPVLRISNTISLRQRQRRHLKCAVWETARTALKIMIYIIKFFKTMLLQSKGVWSHSLDESSSVYSEDYNVKQCMKLSLYCICGLPVLKLNLNLNNFSCRIKHFLFSYNVGTITVQIVKTY